MTVPVMYGRTALTGGGAGALDAIDGTGLVEGDMCLVVMSTGFSVYYLNATSGASESSPNVIAPDTNAGNKRWILKGITSIGIRDNADAVAITIDSTGNVGIGTTTVAYSLVVNNDSVTTSNTISSFFTPNLTNGSRIVLLIGKDEGVNNSAYLGYISNATANQSLLTLGHFGANELMVIRGDGNVGIGTTGPVNKLDVEGAVAIGAAYSGTSAAPTNGLIVEGNVGIGTTGPVNKLDVEGAVAIGAAYSGTRTAPTNGLIVEGNVGIGKYAPAATLHVYGTASFDNGLVDIEGEVEAQTGYFWGNISVESITDRTPAYEGDAITELVKIKGKDGKIDHDTLPVFARKVIKRDVYEDQAVTKTRPVEGSEADETEEYQEIQKVKTGESEEVGRDLGAMISMLTTAVQQLTERIIILENKE